MKKRYIPNRLALIGAALCFLTACLGARRQQANGVGRAFALLVTQKQAVRWDIKSAVQGVFDCDHTPDFAFLGTAGTDVYVGLVRGASHTVVALRFPVSADLQNGLCPGTPRLTRESLDYDPTESVGTVPGFVRSKFCAGLVLHSGECDDFHIFWNQSKQRLDWWRP